jgi:hypothetical protein
VTRRVLVFEMPERREPPSIQLVTETETFFSFLRVDETFWDGGGILVTTKERCWAWLQGGGAARAPSEEMREQVECKRMSAIESQGKGSNWNVVQQDKEDNCCCSVCC